MVRQASTRRLTKLYGELSSVEMVLGTLAAEGVDTEQLRARELYTRGADCGRLPDARPELLPISGPLRVSPLRG